MIFLTGEYDRPTEAEQWHGLAMALCVASRTHAFRDDWDIGDVGDETDRFGLAAGKDMCARERLRR